MKKLLVFFSLLICVSLMLLLVGCTDGGEEDSTVATSESLASKQLEEESITVQNVSGVVAELTFEEMLERSCAVVKGEITGISDAFAVKPVNGGDASNFYEYELTLEKVYVGADSVGDKINVRVQGGLVGNVRTECAETPELSVGTKVIAILSKATKGSNLYVTDEDYYLIVGVNQGIFVIDADEENVTSINKQQETKLGDMVSEIEEFAKDYVVDIDKTYNDAISRLDETLNDGSITQEEYDIYKSFYEKYAERVD